VRTRLLLIIPTVIILALAACTSTSATPAKKVVHDVTVPDETGLAAGDAVTNLQKLKLLSLIVDSAGSVDINAYNVVATQTPSAGSKVKPGTTIHIVTGPGPLIAVPTLKGKVESDANDALSSAHFVEVDTPDGPDDTMEVVKQVPAGGSKAPEGTTVALTFQEPLKVVPKFVGLHFDDLTTKLGETTFVEVDNPSTPDGSWHVTKQVPAAGHQARAGSNVTVFWGPPTVVYTVTGNGSYASSITYSTGGTNQRQAANAHLPWSFSMPEDNGDFTYYAVLAQDGNGSSITCTITDDGQVVTRQTSTGAYAIASCSGS
jgi:beta-lactam-binding protein with PASTA domain